MNSSQSESNKTVGNDVPGKDTSTLLHTNHHNTDRREPEVKIPLSYIMQAKPLINLLVRLFYYF